VIKGIIKKFPALACLILLSQFRFIQLDGESLTSPIDVNDIKTPVAPAFTLLGIEPTSIDQPKTPKAFVLSLLNARTQDEFLPRDYAMMAAPYWLSPHPTLTFDDYYKANIIQTIRQTTVVSLATSRMQGLDSLSQGTNLGFGLNALLVQGKVDPGIWTLRDTINTIQDSILSLIDEYTVIPPEISVIIDTLTLRIKARAVEIQSMDKVRKGFRIELAGGAIAGFPGDKFNEGRITHYGLWLLPAYQLKNPALDLICLGRYIRVESDTSNYYDIGGRIVSTTSDFTISGEFIFRLIKQNAQSDNVYRVNVTAEYRLNPSIQVIGSFGKNFETSKSDLIAFLGVNLGFGQIPVLRLNK